MSSLTPAQQAGMDYLMAMPTYSHGGAMRPGLERIRALLDAMGNPHQRLPIVHVAGTNGKGSTASWTASILTAHGLRCGLHTSPHLLHPGERMRVDGQPAPGTWVGHQVNAWRGIIEDIGASYFEVTVALSLLWFRRQEVDVAVVEVGLGGRLDATNVVEPAVTVVTRVGRDHTDVLGTDLPGIAREKAGIIKPGIPVVVLPQEEDVLGVLRSVASGVGAPFLEVERLAAWSGDTLRLPSGTYQGARAVPGGGHYAWNAAAAGIAVEQLSARCGLPARLSPDSVRRGLAEARTLAGLRARWEVWRTSPLVVLDVAHNPEALLPLFGRFREACGSGSARVILALMKDKQWEPVAEALRRANLSVVPLRLGSPRARPAEELAALLRNAEVAVLEQLEVDGLPDLVHQASQPLLFTGSHQVVEAFLKKMEGI